MSTVLKEAKETLMDQVRALTQSIPNIEELVREVRNAPARPIQDTVWVYNGWDDLTLQYLGQYEYTFPKGQVTRIDARLDHTEPDPYKSINGVTARQAIPLRGESIARELIENRNNAHFSKIGLVVWLTPDVPKKVRDEADEAGKRFILLEIERFKLVRDKARSGQPGYAMTPKDDPRLFRWMKQYCPDDDLFAEQSRRTDSAMDLTRAVTLLTKWVGAQEDAKREPVAPPLAGERPTKYPNEGPASFNGRLVAWEAAKSARDKWDAEHPAASVTAEAPAE